MRSNRPRRETHAPRPAVRLAAAAAGLLVLLASKPLPGQRPEDEVWLISTRGAGAEAAASAWRWTVKQGWRAADVDLLARRDSRPTVVYVHGNRVEAAEAAPLGLHVYRALTRADRDAPAMRFVIWSWPSGRVPGLLRDVRLKAKRADRESLRLARLLARMDPDTETVSLVGYSFGARVVAGALQLLGGGWYAGQRLAAPPARHAPCRAVLLAAAVDAHWLAPGGALARALSEAEQLVVLVNRRDPVLRRYRLLNPRRRPQALGFTGLAAVRAAGAAIVQQDVSWLVGPHHRLDRYLASSRIMRLVERHAL